MENLPEVCKMMQDHRNLFSNEALIEILENYKGKAFMGGYSIFSLKELTMKSLIFSRKFLQILGYDFETLALRFSRGILIKNFQ